jgi:mannose-6-phosphate isomerase-like protein (cupin superfamily)
MILRHLADHIVKTSPTCGAIHEILRDGECSPNLALAFNIGRTVPHYHTTFDEIYFVLDGTIDLRLHDPASALTTVHRLEANEVCVITRGIHHEILSASPANRLAVITSPRFDMSDEHASEVLNRE